MTSRHYKLPSLTQLASFEAAARHLSFKHAANELNVTASAISHQIRMLEDELKISLFLRGHRQVKLTASGEELFAVLSKGFDQFSDAIHKIKAGGLANHVTIMASNAVSSLWLTPKVNRFLREHEGFHVNQHVEDNQNASPEYFDLKITYGIPQDTQYDAMELFQDELVPVTSPDLINRYGNPSLAGLARLPLIHLETRNNWTSWKTWFSELDYLGDINSALRVNSYMIAIQNAQDGAGVALGWRTLLQPLIDKNKLAILSKHSLAAPEKFHLLSREGEQMRDSTETLKKWLLEQVS